MATITPNAAAEEGSPPPIEFYQQLETISLEDARAIIRRIDPKFINQEAVGGGTLLTWAAEFHRFDIIEFLLEMGANPSLEESWSDRTALRWAEDTPPSRNPSLAYQGNRDATIQLLRKITGLGPQQNSTGLATVMHNEEEQERPSIAEQPSSPPTAVIVNATVIGQQPVVAELIPEQGNVAVVQGIRAPPGPVHCWANTQGPAAPPVMSGSQTVYPTGIPGPGTWKFHLFYRTCQGCSGNCMMAWCVTLILLLSAPSHMPARPALV